MESFFYTRRDLGLPPAAPIGPRELTLLDSLVWHSLCLLFSIYPKALSIHTSTLPRGRAYLGRLVAKTKTDAILIF